MKITKIFLSFFILTSVAFAEKYEIKWGLILPLSGEIAKFGVDIKRGFEIALSESKNKNVTHKFIFEDSLYNNRESVTIAQKLVNIDKADIILALWSTADGVAPIAERYNVLHTSIRWNNNIAKKYNNTFTFESTYKDYSENLIHLFKKLNFKKISIISADVAGWELAMGAFLEIAKKEGIEILSNSTYLPSENNFSSIALKAVSYQPDIILINDDGDRVVELAKKIKQFNPKQRLTAYLTSHIDLTLLEGEYGVSQMPLEESFAKKFENKYKEKVLLRANLAYDIFKIIDRILSNYKSKPSTKELVSALKEFENYSGASGKIHKSDNGKVFKTQCEIIKVKNGELTLADDIKAIQLN